MDTPAAECPALEPLVGAAWAAFRDAEVQQADELVERALAARACQVRLVPHGPLLELYRLEGLLALTSGDEEGLATATRRAVVAGPDEPPPERYGADLQARWTTWSLELQARSTVTVQGAGTVWVDGLAVTEGAPRALPRGEHLFQVVDGAGVQLAVRLVDLTEDVTLPTPGAAPAIVVAQPPAAPLPAPPPPAVAPHRRHPAWAFVLAGGGAVLAAGGAGYSTWLGSGCADGTANPADCAAVQPFVDAWLGAAVGGGALALGGTVLGIAGLPPKE
jgi:hypothetical protein